jgi:hypothetical protein
MRDELWTYSEPTKWVDLTGHRVEAIDGSIGKVDEATYDVGSSFIVVDTGPWIFGKKVMLPAGTAERIDPDERVVYVGLTKEQIKASPEFDPERYRSDAYRAKLGGYYTEHRRSA